MKTWTWPGAAHSRLGGLFLFRLQRVFAIRQQMAQHSGWLSGYVWVCEGIAGERRHPFGGASCCTSPLFDPGSGDATFVQHEGPTRTAALHLAYIPAVAHASFTSCA